MLGWSRRMWADVQPRLKESEPELGTGDAEPYLSLSKRKRTG
jgi:hypothetical protein